ncbi:hypothetical protein HK405_013052, partial [Cladochytrium tenue]
MELDPTNQQLRQKIQALHSRSAGKEPFDRPGYGKGGYGQDTAQSQPIAYAPTPRSQVQEPRIIVNAASNAAAAQTRDASISTKPSEELPAPVLVKKVLTMGQAPTPTTQAGTRSPPGPELPPTDPNPASQVPPVPLPRALASGLDRDAPPGGGGGAAHAASPDGENLDLDLDLSGVRDKVPDPSGAGTNMASQLPAETAAALSARRRVDDDYDEESSPSDEDDEGVAEPASAVPVASQVPAAVEVDASAAKAVDEEMEEEEELEEGGV